MVTFTLDNSQAGPPGRQIYTYGVDLYRNGELYFRDQCILNMFGCNGDDQHSGGSTRERSRSDLSVAHRTFDPFADYLAKA